MGHAASGDEGRAIEVVAYAGGRGEEEPRSLRVGERWLEVREVLDRWAEPGRRCFRVRTDDGSVHLVCHLESDLSWRLIRETRRLP